MRSARDVRWRMAPEVSTDVESLVRAVGVTPLTARLLCNRGVSDPGAARTFLRPSLSDLHDPFLLPQMEEAADRIHEAVKRGQRVVVYGDYDVDGITATAILLRCLGLLGAEGRYHIPDRLTEGYGLNAEAVRALAGEGARLLVTVDCGINAVAEVALARKLGMDVIVTDHHEPGEEVPSGALLVNPKLPGGGYPFRELSGAGLAFKLAWALGKRFSAGRRVSPEFREFLLDTVSLAGLGTIADVVALRGENRVLARYGLMGLADSGAVGIRALCEASGVGAGRLSVFDVGFKLAPRLNAAGRLGSARRCVELLTTTSEERARAIAAELNVENARRQRLQEAITEEARAMLADDGGVEGRRSIVLAREGWHAGVLGIVAARLAEEFWRPAILLTLEGDEGHGSGRSIGPVNLFEALCACAGRLEGFGGHAMAAGLRLKRSEVERFAEEFEAAVAARLGPEDLRPTMGLDAEVRMGDITRALVGELEQMEPFGVGNPEPLLLALDVGIGGEVRRMGSDGRHISFWARQDGVAIRTVGFGMGGLADALADAGVCSMVVVPRLNRWRGRESVELEARDIRPGRWEGPARGRG